MMVPARNFAIAAAALCTLAGVVILFSVMRPAEPHRFRSPSRMRSSSADPIASPLTVRPEPASLPGTGAQAATAGAAAAGFELPAPPSGDYELDLTPEQIDGLVEKRYGPLLRTLRLPPAKIGRLRSLLTERLQASVDAANAALLVGLNPVRDLATIRQAIAQAEASVDTALRDELGASVLSACREFDRTLRERNAVADFDRLLAATREPLRPEQGERVVQILRNSPGSEAPADMNRAIFGDIDSRSSISPQAIAAAAGVLSPSQLEMLRRMQQRPPSAEAPGPAGESPAP